MRWFLKVSDPPMFSPINYFNFIPQGQMVSLFLPYMVRYTRLFNLTSYYCLPMFFLPYFQWATCLTFVYFTTTARDGVNSSWSCWISKKKKYIKQNFHLFLTMLLKFKVILTRIGQVIRWQNFIKFFFIIYMSGRPGFNPRLCHTKDFKNGTWYLLA